MDFLGEDFRNYFIFNTLWFEQWIDVGVSPRGFFGRLSWRGTEADSYGPDFVGPQSFSCPVDAQRRLPTVQIVVGPRFPSLLTR